MATEISIIIPTLNEAENLPLLLPRIQSALAGFSYNVVVVDDGSTDGTPEVARRLTLQYPLSIESRGCAVGGLGGAVLHGFEHSSGEILVVMDADLQHPPEYLPSIIRPIRSGEADLVIGSRYTLGGDVADSWGCLRRVGSLVAKRLAAPLTGSVRDALSGFFSIRRTIWKQLGRLDPMGFKIGLEILCRCDLTRVMEIPIRFDERRHGTSKLTFTQQLTYVRHLARLYRRHRSQGPLCSGALCLNLPADQRRALKMTGPVT